MLVECNIVTHADCHGNVRDLALVYSAAEQAFTVSQHATVEHDIVVRPRLVNTALDHTRVPTSVLIRFVARVRS